jgi:hypothetical protein
MYLSITSHADPADVALIEPEDYTRLHVAVPAHMSLDTLEVALHRKGIGHVASSSQVWLSISALKAIATAGDADRARQFDDMVAFAQTKGWVDDTGTHVQAHVISSDI